jgi:hypothetical protein
MTTMTIAFWLPPKDGVRTRATFASDHRMSKGSLEIDGEQAIPIVSLAAPIEETWNGRRISLCADGGEVELEVDGEPALREDRMHAPISRSAIMHAVIALLASFAGFVASWLYLARAGEGDPWALKMAIHMAGWHLLLTLTLFPASIWGQRFGIRAVQVMSALFFVIHAGIALANVTEAFDGIALFNALSGVAFLGAVVYGQRAHRDMDPLRALAERVIPRSTNAGRS